MDVLGVIFDEFDSKEMLSKLESNLNWKDKTEKNTMMTDKFRDKLKQLDPELLKEFDELEYLKTGLIATEEEIYFVEGFKQGVKFVSKCMD